MHETREPKSKIRPSGTLVLARSAPKPHAAFVVWSSAQPQGATPPPPANLQHYTVIVNLPDVKAGYMK